MNEKNVVICDSQIRYTNSLAENICKRKDLAVKVYACSNLEQVASLSQNTQIHLLLVDEEYTQEKRQGIVAEQVFVLSKDKEKTSQKEKMRVYKYQNVDEIIRIIFEAYMENTGNNVMQTVCKTPTKLVAVYSPIHRIGKTKFALALGKALAKKKRVLYLNLEEYAGFDHMEDDGMNLGDLLYYMKQGNGKLGLRLQTAVKRTEELEYIRPISMVLDLKDVTREEWLTLLEVIVQDTAYEVVILDIGESIQGLFQILELCHLVYMPVIEDEISHKKEKQYQHNIEKLKLEKLKKNTYRFLISENMDGFIQNQTKEEW